MPALSGWRTTLLGVLAVLAHPAGRWRQAPAVLLWLLLMLGAVPLSDHLKSLDWRLLDALRPAPAAWPGQVALVDLGWNLDPAGTAAYRRQAAATLRALADLQPAPAIVVLDVTFSTLPVEIEALQGAMARLRERRVPIVQVTDLSGFAAGLTKSQVLEHQGQRLLHDFGGAGYGHSAFEFSVGGTAWYAPCVTPPTLDDVECLEAVPRLVEQLVSRREKRPMPRADALPVVLVPGSDGQALARTWRWQAEGGWRPATPAGAGDPGAALGGRIVVVGNLDHDRLGPWSGPALLGWAIGDAIATPDTPRTVLLRRPLWALLAGLLFSGVALLLFRLLCRLDRRARRLTWTLAGTVAGSALLLALAILGLRSALQVAYYQVGYVLLAVMATAGVAWHALRTAIRERALYTVISDERGDERRTWDVFVSYSHSPIGNIDRVRREVVEPLKRLQKPDGSRLDVFFDDQSIRIGTSWYLELAEGIEGSRCFVALYTSDYFRKSFCRFELRKAVVRDIQAQGQGFVVLPFRLDRDAEPLPEFSHLQYRAEPKPVEIVEAVRAVLAQQGVSTR